MKKEGRYRFSLQFSSESEEQKRVGDFLEKLGNRKSYVIVAALNEYLDAHPELHTDGCKIEVKVTTEYTQKKIEQIVQSIVEERLAALQPLLYNSDSGGDASTDENSEKDIAQMLDNLSAFE